MVEMNSKSRGNYRLRELRMKIYNDVLRLREQELGYKKIRKEIQRIHGEKLSLATLSYWIRGIHSPYNGRRFPSIIFFKPSQKLSYIIGVNMGDGYLKKKNKERKGYNEVYIELESKDLEFVEEFSRCLGIVLDRKPPKIKYRKSRYKYITTVKDKTLFELLNGRSIDKIRPFAEHCDGCKAMFLRGFFDSEGCISKVGTLRASNSNYELLQYVKELLADLGIETTGPHLHLKKGTLLKCPRTGRIYRRKRDIYHIQVRKRSLLTFYQKIGFTIIRKHQRLEEYLRWTQGLLSQAPSNIFPEYKVS